MKTRTWLALVAIMALVAALAVPATQAQAISGSLVGYKISATDANTTTTFPTANGAMLGLSIYNDSANEIFVAINGVATTGSTEIPAGASMALDDFTATSIGIICSAGETATVYLYATYR